MRVRDVIHGLITTLELVPTLGDPLDVELHSGAEVFLRPGADGEPALQVGEKGWPVSGASRRDEERLRRICLGNRPRLCWLVQSHPPGKNPRSLTVQVHEIPGRYVWEEPAEIGVDDKLLEEMRKRFKRLVSVASVVDWLGDKMLLPPRESGGPARLLLSGSPRRHEGVRVAFRIHGQGHAADVIQDSGDKLKVTRVVSARRAQQGDEKRTLYLVTGPVSFCDITVAGVFRGTAQTELDQLVARSDSYLGLWREYNERERKAILTRARRVGGIKYERVEPVPGTAGQRFFIARGADATVRASLDDLRDLTLQAGADLPASILGQDDIEAVPNGRQRAFIGDVRKVRFHPTATIDIMPPDDTAVFPPKKGYLHVSLIGDDVRLRRRQEAWDSVKSSTCPMPQIGLLIEGKEVPEASRRPVDAITPDVIDLFPGVPTARQKEALHVALNTPDIALIQGPPGTGKTRVATALQARLASPDEAGTEGGLSGATLLSSFQHDAVETVASASRAMGLPAVKVGRRKGHDEPLDGVESWRVDTLEAVRAARAIRGESGGTVQGALSQLRSLAVAYLEAPSHQDDPQDIMKRALEITGPWLPTEVLDRASALRQQLGHGPGAMRSTGDEDRELALRIVRGLRTESPAFSDDGPSMAYRALSRLRDLEGFELEDTEAQLLQDAAAVVPGDCPPADLLAALGHLKESLIDRLSPPPEPGRNPQPHIDVAERLTEMIDALQERAATVRQGVGAAVEEWLADLEYDRQGVRDVVRHYTMLLAATCQQSVSRAMADAKGGEGTVFRTVVIDEAARSNPLDLMIPMSRAERRIVLVGDHRQLPHILEPEIEQELALGVSEETRDLLQKSLFWRLFEDLKQREQADGVKRTVTLDVQYRMHPALGAFVSEQFYEKYGEGFRSGREAREFTHKVTLAGGTSLEDRVAAWIDVPHDRGPEQPGQSKCRPVEAARVAKEARAILDSSPDLSLGVITFYRAQLQSILEEMERHDLTERDGEGGYRVKSRLQGTSDGRRERLRIGTVDAFQGKEFDVVLLSLTRSNTVKVTDEATRKRRYGFLLLENRLCVAMSRQHRLLLVVGDSQMAIGPVAEASVPALTTFLKFCEGEHGACIL